MPVTLAADLGSTRVKIGLVSDTGELLNQVSLPAPPITVSGTCADIDPELWWAAFCDGTAALIGRGGSAARIAAIAVTGPTRTQVVVDADGRPLLPAMTWSDTRGQRQADALRGSEARDHPETAQINAFHPLARLAWIAAERPDLMARAHATIEPKDFIVARLTGVIQSDPVSQARLTAAAAAPGPSGAGLFEAARVPSSLLPPLRLPHEIAGHVRTGLEGAVARLAGVPVLTGSNDTWTAVLGLGAMRPGYAYAISGTTEVLGLVTDRPCQAEGLLAVDWGPDLVQIGGPGLNGADTLSWLTEVISDPADDAAHTEARLTALLAAPRHPQPVLFLPYLRGERVPFWDAGLRGAFLGLSREHTATDLAWAVLEGLALLNRTVLARAEAAAGSRVGEVRMGGGLSRLPVAAQIKADVLACAVVVGASEEAGLIGSGLLAAVGVHGAASLAAVQEHVPVGHRYQPDPGRRMFYDAMFSIFTEAHAAVAPLSHRLARQSLKRE